MYVNYSPRKEIHVYANLGKEHEILHFQNTFNVFCFTSNRIHG